MWQGHQHSRNSPVTNGAGGKTTLAKGRYDFLFSEATTAAVEASGDAHQKVTLMWYCGNDGAPTQVQFCCVLPRDPVAPRGVFLGEGRPVEFTFPVWRRLP
mmetsp:Transcript_138839/g.276872  ORF Transcript_138839/g.276872 Transcript_138839/m.276872 type:complete len:101 (+) Transcript_138839:162-464(+)